MPYIELPATDKAGPLTTYYETWGHADRPLMLLVHELGGTLESYRPFAEQLATHFHVIAYDQRGAGRSEHPTTPWTIADLAEDIQRLAEADFLSAEFHLFGLAMGAAVAAQYAATYRGRLLSLTLCDGTSQIDDGARSYLRERSDMVRASGMRAVAEQSFKNSFRGLRVSDHPDWSSYLQRFACNPPQSYAAQSDALADFHLTPAQLATIDVPTAVLTGRHDFIWPPASGEQLAGKIPDAVFLTIEQAAHFPPIQNTTTTAEIVLDFVRGIQRS